jgi:hypothetical protein
VHSHESSFILHQIAAPKKRNRFNGLIVVQNSYRRYRRAQAAGTPAMAGRELSHDRFSADPFSDRGSCEPRISARKFLVAMLR